MANYLDETVNALDEGLVPDWITAHAKAYEQSGGVVGHLWDSTGVGGRGLVPCLLLTTVGRKSGRFYTHPLLYGQDGERFVIVGSKGGSDTQPRWYFNLIANSIVTVQVKADKFRARATLVEGSEREPLWKLMTEVYPAYLDYQAKTSRELPVFSLERISE
jgi:proline iminopeptidase